MNTQFKLGSYQGTCTNTTGKEPVVSRLTLTLARQEQQSIYGKITTAGALDVDLEFAGTVAGNQIQFVTITPNKKLTIEWLAVIQVDSLRGTFSATNTGFWASVFDSTHQHGEWQCSKERFPIIRRLKSFAQGVLGVIVFIVIIVGVIAFNSDSTPSISLPAYIPSSTPSTIQPESFQTYYQPTYTPTYNPPYARQQPPQQGAWDSLQRIAKDPQTWELIGEGVKLLLDQKAGASAPKDVHVRSYVDRNGRYVPEYDRSHPNSNK